MRRAVLLLLLLAGLFIQPVAPASAQSGILPTYVVQPGDTLTVIAFRFGVALQDLIDVNNISDPAMVGAGTHLAIPGLEGVSGILNAKTVMLGETLNSLSRRHRFPTSQLVNLNRITSPTEIFAGASVIVPQLEEEDVFAGTAALSPGQSLLELASTSAVNPWLVVLANGFSSTSEVLPGELLFYPSDIPADDVSPISPLVTEFDISPLPVAQGGTASIRLETAVPMQLRGALNGVELEFVPTGERSYVALQGLHAMAKPGLTSFSISGTAKDGSSFDFEQSILLKPGYYPDDPPLNVDPSTIDPSITRPEEEQLLEIVQQFSPVKAWDGPFQRPVDEPWCIKSWFGNRRSYNQSDFTYFHTGVDYGVCANLNIYAPAAGKVVFAGPLAVRGNATIIDHGWGVFSGIWHQNTIAVDTGDVVEAGQMIGEIGATGRVTGPHLHWEIWVNGIQVEPLDWLDQSYPPEAAE